MVPIVLSILFWILVVPITVFFCVSLTIVWLATLPFDRVAAWPRAVAARWGRTLVRANPAWRVTITGHEHVGAGPYVIVANHQSQSDILSMLFLRHHFKFISKASLFRIPLFGWCMWMSGYISLVRGDRESIAKCMAEAAAWIRRGVSVAFFPEGTRSPDGHVQPFKLGAFRLAAETGARILPVTVSGTDRVLPKGGWIFERRAHIRVRVDAPIDPPGAADAEVAACAERVRAGIAARKAELDALPA